MITQTLTTSFKVELLQAVHNFNTDTFKIALYPATANLSATTTVYSSTGELPTANGYTTTGETLTVNPTPTSGSSGGTTAYVSFDNISWTSASFTAAGALIYNSSKADRSVAVLNFGDNKTASGTFTITFPAANASNAIIRIA